MSEYTYKNLIVDPTSEEAKTCIGKRVYYSTNPTSCLQYANDHDMDCCKVLKGINLDDMYPFVLEDNTYLCSCIILCLEEPEPEYIPFETMEEFVDRYSEVMKWADYDSFEDNLLQCGMWLKYIDDNDKPVYILVCEIKDEGVKLDEHGRFTWEELLSKGFLFPNDKPCGRLRESNSEEICI